MTSLAVDVAAELVGAEPVPRRRGRGEVERVGGVRGPGEEVGPDEGRQDDDHHKAEAEHYPDGEALFAAHGHGRGDDRDRGHFMPLKVTRGSIDT